MFRPNQHRFLHVLFLTILFQSTNIVAVESETKPTKLAPIDENVLALNDEIKALLDQEVGSRRTKLGKLERLHELLYDKNYQHIRYTPSGNFSAIDTFYNKEGNCMSLANLFIAAARYVGLNARFQSVKVKKQWRPHETFYEVPGHMNVLVKLPTRSVTIEFNQTFQSDAMKGRLVSKVISDRQAKAEYLNNLGAEELSNGNEGAAIEYFETSVKHFPKLDFVWSNLGVVQKRIGHFEAAEASYLEALRINQHNTSALGNIYILYDELGNKEKAKQYTEKAQALALKNPYNLEKLAKGYLANRQYKQSVKMFRKAIGIYNKEPSFHHGLANAYYHLGDKRKTKRSLERAQKLSSNEQKRMRYQNKLDALSLAQ